MPASVRKRGYYSLVRAFRCEFLRWQEIGRRSSDCFFDFYCLEQMLGRMFQWNIFACNGCIKNNAPKGVVFNAIW